MDSAIAALLGVGLTASASLGALLVQQRSESRRDRIRLAVQAALEDQKILYQSGKDAIQGTGRTFFMQPLSASIHYHAKVIELLDEGRLNEESLRALGVEQDRVHAMFKEASNPKPRSESK